MGTTIDIIMEGEGWRVFDTKWAEVKKRENEEENSKENLDKRIQNYHYGGAKTAQRTKITKQKKEKEKVRNISEACQSSTFIQLYLLSFVY